MNPRGSLKQKDMTLHQPSISVNQAADGGETAGATGIFPQLLQAVTALTGAPDARVFEGVQRLSRLFTVDREQLDPCYLADPLLRRAYLLYFLPVNYAKVASVLDEVAPLPVRALRILDLGSGPGVGAFAVLDHLARRGVKEHRGTEILAAERNREPLRDAEALWEHLSASFGDPSGCALHTLQLDLERPGSHAPWKKTQFDVIMMSNSLNELFTAAREPIARRAKFIDQLLAALADDGSLIIIEPALRDTTRALHEVRDRIVSEGTATVFSPCLHDLPCPALTRPTDWCHEERGWDPPAVVQEIDRAIGFIKDALKFSYLVLRKDRRTILDREPDIHRVVSEKLVMKGESRVWLCNETGRQLVGRLDKARSAINAPFDNWHRGAIVRVDQIERTGSVGRIGADNKVALVRAIESR
jgi:ribosomal protein RSM22 (predicted rRNA methylase)